MEENIKTLLQQIDALRKDLQSLGPIEKAEQRSKLRTTARQLSLALEEPGDIVERVCYQFMETVNIRIAIGLGLFKILTESESPKTTLELADMTKADPILLGRILRGLAAVGAVEDAGVESYTPTKVAQTFTRSSLAAAVEHNFDFLGPIWTSIPSWLAANQYRNPDDMSDTAFHIGHGTKENLSSFMARNPRYLDAYQRYMTSANEGRASWMDFFPVQERLGKNAHKNQEAVFFVDIGGGMGHEASALHKRFPELPGRFVLQDLPEVVSQVQAEGLEVIPHDFFNPQPVKGARVYYFRNVLHDWNDDAAVNILRLVRNAMDPNYSKILINQWVVPVHGATSFMTHQDLNMMAVFAGMERTEQQLRELLQRADLQIEKIWSAGDDISEQLIETVAII
ncbi:hypothetical protein ACLMJK_006959 [Lecanora helva]